MKVRFIHMKVGQRLGLLAALLMLTISSFAADLNWNFTFSPSDIVLTPRGEYTFVSLTDGSNPTDAIGAPAVPAKFVNILLGMLTAKGYPCDIDGKFDNSDAEQLKKYQAANGLTVDGACGPDTWYKIFN